MWHWLARWLGMLNLAGPIYGWWSGSGSVIIPLAVQISVFGAIWWWHHQCTVHHCYWPSRRLTAAGERACFKHHPHPKPTAQDIHRRHHAILRSHHPDAPEGTPP